jgi:hypothetical protein
LSTGAAFATLTYCIGEPIQDRLGFDSSTEDVEKNPAISLASIKWLIRKPIFQAILEALLQRMMAAAR